ncbi:acyltransferase family protein [Roseibium sp.]|uniref:acyltransferase family protein n=1 Tax=Roseibium sp. TaxID=1936156 RepID=UPI003BA88F1F
MIAISHDKFSDAFDARSNNFDLIRIVAACLVIFSHAFPLLALTYEPIAELTNHYETGGGFAVNAFIVISGFLICRSLERATIISYAWSRFLRIVPALAAVTLAQMFVLGPIFTTVSLPDYFSNASTWSQLKNLTVFNMQFRLETIFMDVPFAQIVNNPLWTLPIESFFYICLPIAFFIGLKGRKYFWLVPVSCLTGLYVMGLSGCSFANQCGASLWTLQHYTTLRLACFFSLGASIWIYRHSIPHSGWIAAGLVVVLALLPTTYLFVRDMVFAVFYSYLVMYVGCLPKLHIKTYEKLGDLSYGTYIVGWPVQQSILTIFGTGFNPYVFGLVAIPPSLVLAYFMWNYVEKPALALKHHPVLTQMMKREA